MSRTTATPTAPVGAPRDRRDARNLWLRPNGWLRPDEWLRPDGWLRPNRWFGGRAAAGRPRLWREILLIAVCYGAYSIVRNLVPTRHTAALHRAGELLSLERTLHVDVELSLNGFFSRVGWLGVGANYYYATLHFVVTIGVLGWLFARHPGRYRTYRWWMFGTTVSALIGFWFYPLAPPRMLPGYVDTVLAFHTWGLYDSSPIATMSNQYAAMPSLHTAWSLWCAVAIVRVARPRWVKILAACYPLCTVLVIIGTANHFILDAVGGVASLACGVAVAVAAVRLSAALRRRRPPIRPFRRPPPHPDRVLGHRLAQSRSSPGAMG